MRRYTTDVALPFAWKFMMGCPGQCLSTLGPSAKR